MTATDALRLATQPSPGKLFSFVLAIAVHLLLLAFLFYGVRWQNQKPEAIEVELVQAAPPIMEPAAQPVEPPPPPPPTPVAEPETKLPPPKPDIIQKDKEKPKPAPQEKPQPSSSPFQKQLEQELKQAAERKQTEAAKAAVDRELQQVRAAQAAAARDKANADYIARIRGKIKGNILLPPDIKGNPEALFDVVQLPSGEILSVALKKSSGHVGYDAAVERAILKSSPLPRPEPASVFSRELELKFRPKEE